MKDQDLIRMANQIASYFAAYGEAEAVTGIAAHVTSFWDPRMRAQLLAFADDAADLDPLVKQAVKELKPVTT